MTHQFSTRTLTLILAFSLFCLVAAFTLLVLKDTGAISFYHGANSGILIGHWGGLETSGTPGFFSCRYGQC